MRRPGPSDAAGGAGLEDARMRDEQGLVEAAREARRFAVARFSNFLVGAALETADGVIVTGCNVENATLGLTVCAERVALLKALSEGHRRFTRLVVVAATDVPTPPCGACRQLLWEFCGDLDVILANDVTVSAHHRLASLFPHPFDATLLNR
jgi:cytidine deaminase